MFFFFLAKLKAGTAFNRLYIKTRCDVVRVCIGDRRRDLTGSGAKQVAHQVAQVGLSGAHAQEAPFELHHRLPHLDVHGFLEPGETFIGAPFQFGFVYLFH